MDFHQIYWHLCCLLLLTINIYSSYAIDLTIDVNPGARECFYQSFKEKTEVEIEYQVIEGGDLDVNFVVQSPKGRVLLSELRKMEGDHKFVASDAGDYAFCIDNTFSRFSNKVVFFEILTDVDDDDDEAPIQAALDDNIYDVKIEDFKMAFDEMLDKLKRCTQLQNVIRAIESRDRSIQEHNFERVNFWSSIHIFILISVALTHVLMIRGLFSEDDKHKTTKMRT